MGKQISSVEFLPDQYDDNEYIMWQDIAEFIRIMLKNKYVFVVKQEDFGIVSLEYEYADREFGGDYPVWLSPEEEESVAWDSDQEVDRLREKIREELKRESNLEAVRAVQKAAKTEVPTTAISPPDYSKWNSYDKTTTGTPPDAPKYTTAVTSNQPAGTITASN